MSSKETYVLELVDPEGLRLGFATVSKLTFGHASVLLWQHRVFLLDYSVEYGETGVFRYKEIRTHIIAQQHLLKINPKQMLARVHGD